VRERWNLKKESKFKEMIRGNGWTKAYNFNEKDMEPDDSYWSDDDDILNDLQELPLEDPDKDENIPKCRKSEHAPKIGSSDTVAVPYQQILCCSSSAKPKTWILLLACQAAK
jgi:hypothetical protein